MSTPLVTIHDQHHLELKLTHPLEVMPKAGRMFEAWLYFPNSLGIDEPLFRKEDFYSDLTAYVRFQTPHMSLGALLGSAPAHELPLPDDGARAGPRLTHRVLSPFVRLQRYKAEIVGGSQTPMALRELRLLAASFRSVVRDNTRFIVTGLRFAPLPAARVEHVAAAGQFVAESGVALGRFRALRAQLSDAPPDVRVALLSVDDFLSMHALEGWFLLLRSLKHRGDGLVDAGPVAQTLRAAISAETAYRVQSGLLGAPADGPGLNEPYVTRVNQLKKWVMGVLHLRLTTNRRAERARELAFSVAAAAAMTVAVALQLFALWTVGTPKTPQVASGTLFAFVALSVGGYILKDAIKDRLKTWFQARIPRWLFDRRQDLRVPGDPGLAGAAARGGASFGAVEETVGRMNAADVPPEVIRVRERDEEALYVQERLEEDVIHYRRKVHLDGARTRAQAPEMVAITEILRLNITRWIRRMDDPSRPLSRLDADGNVQQVEGRKTYRVTLVMASEGPGGACRYDKRSIVLTRQGLIRVE